MSYFKFHVFCSELQAAGAKYLKLYFRGSEQTLGTFKRYKLLERNPQLLWVLEM